jgi:hypothetical protein
MRLHQIPGHVGQPKFLEGGAQAQGDIIEDELALDTHFQLFSPLLELPGENATVGSG